jgi:glutathione S-transferase
VYSLGQVRAFTTIMPKHEEVVKFARARSESALKMLDRHLGGSKFLVGTAPTIADIAVFPWIATAHEGGFAVANYPNVHAWAERMLVIPGAAHPYTILPKEDRVAA